MSVNDRVLIRSGPSYNYGSLSFQACLGWWWWTRVSSAVAVLEDAGVQRRARTSVVGVTAFFQVLALGAWEFEVSIRQQALNVATSFSTTIEALLIPSSLTGWFAFLLYLSATPIRNDDVTSPDERWHVIYLSTSKSRAVLVKTDPPEWLGVH